MYTIQQRLQQLNNGLITLAEMRRFLQLENMGRDAMSIKLVRVQNFRTNQVTYELQY